MTTLGQLLGSVLRDVSRSFFISIRLLPRRLREPIGLAYLLARSTDTLADTTSVPVALRMEALQTVKGMIQGSEPDFSGGLDDLQRSFIPLQTDAAERTLLQVLPDCLRLLALLNAADRGDIRDLLRQITRGQMLDLERFGHPEADSGLNSAAELNEYTYLVAGCVGEFWTSLCFRYLINFSRRSEAEMTALGVSYGNGLQLTNILRDAGADLAAGRCYFPADELQAHGVQWRDLRHEPERFQPVYQNWLDAAQRGLEAGMEYVAAVDNFRVRAATVLPALIGASTLSLLRRAGPAALLAKIKVSRQEVRATLATVTLTLARRDTLQAMFKRAIGGT